MNALCLKRKTQKHACKKFAATALEISHVPPHSQRICSINSLLSTQEPPSQTLIWLHGVCSDPSECELLPSHMELPAP